MTTDTNTARGENATNNDRIVNTGPEIFRAGLLISPGLL